MKTDTIIRATPPGNYKRIKSYDPGRVCECGVQISIYNKTNVCYTCGRK